MRNTMGALALPTPWIPEDDLLLKNAVEAGASLESLAKGAVQFSRRYTVKELQDRWHALLYDPIISTRAAEQMLELERSATNLASKSNKADNSKGTKNASGKRKAESVRRCYYAMRKRVCNEPHNQGDMSFLVSPSDNCFMNVVEAPGPDNMLGNPMSGHFEVEQYEDVDFDDLRREFPQIMRNSAPSCGVSEFSIEQCNTFEGHMEQSTMLPNNMSVKEHPGHSMPERSGIQENSGCNRKVIMCSGIEGNTVFNPSIPACETPFPLQYTSPPPAMPDWETIESMPVPEISDDIQTGDPYVDNDAGGTSEFDMHTKSGLNNQMTGDDLKNPTDCHDGLFAELSVNPLFDFSNSEGIHIFDGGKSIDNTYLEEFSSLLLDSPNDVNENDRMPNMCESKEPSAVDVYIDIPCNTGPEEKIVAVDSHMCDINLQNSLDAQMPTSSACINSEFPERCNGVIICTSNIEQFEVPCIDDIVFPGKPRPASANRRAQSEANSSLLHGKDTCNPSSGKGHSTMKKEQKRFGESHPASQKQVPDGRLNCAVDELGVKIETSKAETFHDPRSSGSGYGGPCQSSQAVKKEPSEFLLTRQPACGVAEKPGQFADFSHLQTAVGGTSQEVLMSAHNNQELHALGSVDGMAAEPVGETVLSDLEEEFSESDTDIPSFSDVEAMILDMDLGPEDQDLFCSREVAKYQQKDVRRTVRRLEQNSQSYMQRAMSLHGAIAVLYGRDSKHFIKKPEVLIGRATDDVMVDIDLGRGCANKISRRQAIIKMDNDGAFNIKNTGKGAIYMNSNEVFSGQSFGLHTKCIVEIRGMPFVFETNEDCIKKFLDNANAAQKFGDKKHNI